VSGLPGFNSRSARVVLRIALALENLHRRRHGQQPMTGALNITINGVGYRTTGLPLQGHVGGADVALEAG
jgi:hypothetical protein